jgi:hypothetical protein
MVSTRHWKAPIAAHLARPRNFTYLRGKRREASEFSYQKVQNGNRYGWQILYMGQAVTVLDTMKEVEAFIEEKLET